MRTISIAIAVAALAATAHAKPAHTWSRLHFGMERGDHKPGGKPTIDVYADGRVIFSNPAADADAATVAKAPRELLDEIDAWTAKGPAPGPAKLTTAWIVHVDLEEGGKTRSATYPSDQLPADEKALFTDAGKLINQPRTPAPCPAWDGKGAFTLTLVSQDFGAVPGPVTRVTIASTGAATRAAAGGAADATLKVNATAKASKDEVAAIRAALVTIDLGHFTDVFGGAGEGSNLRLVHLQTPAGACGRAFTNAWPDGMKPLGDAIAPVTARFK